MVAITQCGDCGFARMTALRENSSNIQCALEWRAGRCAMGRPVVHFYGGVCVFGDLEGNVVGLWKPV